MQDKTIEDFVLWGKSKNITQQSIKLDLQSQHSGQVLEKDASPRKAKQSKFLGKCSGEIFSKLRSFIVPENSFPGHEVHSFD